MQPFSAKKLTISNLLFWLFGVILLFFIVSDVACVPILLFLTLYLAISKTKSFNSGKDCFSEPFAKIERVGLCGTLTKEGVKNVYILFLTESPGLNWMASDSSESVIDMSMLLPLKYFFDSNLARFFNALDDIATIPP